MSFEDEMLCGFNYCLQLDWSKGKVSPLVSSIRARLRPRPMPLNIFQDLDGLPRIILTEPTGSSAEVINNGTSVSFFSFLFPLPKFTCLFTAHVRLSGLKVLWVNIIMVFRCFYMAARLFPGRMR